MEHLAIEELHRRVAALLSTEINGATALLTPELELLYAILRQVKRDLTQERYRKKALAYVTLRNTTFKHLCALLSLDVRLTRRGLLRYSRHRLARRKLKEK